MQHLGRASSFHKFYLLIQKFILGRIWGKNAYIFIHIYTYTKYIYEYIFQIEKYGLIFRFIYIDTMENFFPIFVWVFFKSSPSDDLFIVLFYTVNYTVNQN